MPPRPPLDPPMGDEGDGSGRSGDEGDGSGRSGDEGDGSGRFGDEGDGSGRFGDVHQYKLIHCGARRLPRGARSPHNVGASCPH